VTAPDPTRIDHIYAHRGAAVGLLAAATIFDGTTGPVVSDHHGVLVRIGPAPAPPVAPTRITAHVDVGWGNYLAVRGSSAPLDWTAGWPAVATAAGTWTLVVTEIADGAAFEYKCPRDDSDYQTGANATGVGGTDNDVTPAF
jgi:hypothetical protein